MKSIKMNIRNRLVVLTFSSLFLLALSVKAQNNKPFSYGIYTSLDWFSAQAHNPDGIADGSDADFSGGEVALGYSFGGSVQHNTLKWLSLRSGLIFQQRNYTYGYDDINMSPSYVYGQRNMYMLSVPAVIRFKPGKVFSFNAGTEFNFALGRGKDEDWGRLTEPEYFWGDITLYTSFEFRLYQGLHIGFGLNIGLTPWGESLVQTGSKPPQETNTYRNRGLFINLQYIFER
jgi:hypothetical protein